MTPLERLELASEIATAIRSNSNDALTAEEQHWVRQAIQRQAQSLALRRAIIEKTLAGLVWATLIALGVMIMSFLREHGFK